MRELGTLIVAGWRLSNGRPCNASGPLRPRVACGRMIGAAWNDAEIETSRTLDNAVDRFLGFAHVDVPPARSRPRATRLRDQRGGEHRQRASANAADLRGRGPHLPGANADQHPPVLRERRPAGHVDPPPDPEPRRQPRRRADPVRARGTPRDPDPGAPVQRSRRPTADAPSAPPRERGTRPPRPPSPDRQPANQRTRRRTDAEASVQRRTTSAPSPSPSCRSSRFGRP